jgi:translation initiation factor 3 subunit B
MAPIPPSRQMGEFPLTEDGELDFTDLEKEYAVSYEEGFDNVILVDNCPIVEEDARKQKLTAFIKKIFSGNGKIKDDGIYMPMGLNPKTGKVESKGYFPCEIVF